MMRRSLKDFYGVMGVDASAAPDVIKGAYRKLAQRFHPDRNPDDPEAEERFKAVQEAYSVLSDPRKRRAYDRLRSGERITTPGGRNYYRRSDGSYARESAKPQESGDLLGDVLSGIGDFVSRLFGGAPQTSHSVTISFEQALKGGRLGIPISDGSRVRIRVPAGVRDGFKIRLKGNGAATFVTFRVADHPQFSREGDDLTMTLKLNALEAILGVTRMLKDPYGELFTVEAPPGTQHGHKLRVVKRGVRSKRGTGDLLVFVEIAIPKNLTPSQRDALRAAAQNSGLL